MPIFFNSWDSVIRIALTILFAYPGLIILMRIYGKRTLSKLNMFDFIIAVSLGSTFASVVTSKDVTIADGLVAFALLLSSQFVITWATLRWQSVGRMIKSEPTLLFFDGAFFEKELTDERITRHEIFAEIRQSGIASLDAVYAVVLETNGMISVLEKTDSISRSTLEGVKNFNQPQSQKEM